MIANQRRPKNLTCEGPGRVSLGAKKRRGKENLRGRD